MLTGWYQEERRQRNSEMTGRWSHEGAQLPSRTPFQRSAVTGTRKVSAADLLAEREKYFAEQRQLLLNGRMGQVDGGGNDVFSSFLAERESRLRRLGGGLFAESTLSTRPCHSGGGGGVLADHQSAFTAGSGHSVDASVTNIPVHTVQPSAAQTVHSTAYTAQPGTRVQSTLEDRDCDNNKPSGASKDASDHSDGVNGTSSEPSRERVIPIQILDEPMLPRLARGSSQEGAPPATTPLPSLFADLKLEATAARSSPFDHPRLTANFGRLGTAFGDDLLAFKSGIRESLFSMPNFGKFPSFGPILPGDSVNLSPINRRSGSAAGKKRLQKSKSSADKPSFG